jgi:hypothetical protein
MKRSLLVVAALVAILVTAGSASAYQYWSTGAIGPSATSKGRCTFNNAWNNITLSTPIPTVYARDNTYGAGNDAQWVRYRIYLVDAAGNDIGQPTTWSEWELAYDNARAPFTNGQAFFSLNPRGAYRLDMRIEWWNSTSMLGATAHRITSYGYYTGGGYFGDLDPCRTL